MQQRCRKKGRFLWGERGGKGREKRLVGDFLSFVLRESLTFSVIEGRITKEMTKNNRFCTITERKKKRKGNK